MHMNILEDLIEDMFNFPQSREERIVETKDSFVITTDQAGVKKKNIDIYVESGFLTVSSTRGIPSDEGVKVLSEGQFRKSYKKSYKLGTNLNVDDIEADLSDGVLTITIPKKEEDKKKSVKIT